MLIIATKPGCPRCRKKCAELDAAGIAYQTVNVGDFDALSRHPYRADIRAEMALRDDMLPAMVEVPDRMTQMLPPATVAAS